MRYTIFYQVPQRISSRIRRLGVVKTLSADFMGSESWLELLDVSPAFGLFSMGISSSSSGIVFLLIFAACRYIVLASSYRFFTVSHRGDSGNML